MSQDDEPASVRGFAVPINGQRHLWMTREGRGAPSVIFAPMLGGETAAWEPLKKRIAAITTVVTYAGAGSPMASPGPLPRTTGAAVDDLRLGLEALGVSPPYVLVAHSAGAFDALLFAFRHQDEVAGLLLIDPSILGMEDLYRLLPEQRRKDANDRRRLVEDVEAAHREGGRNRALNVLSEWDSFAEASVAELVAARRPLEGVPFVVLSSTELVTDDRQAAFLQLWHGEHSAYAALSDLGRHVVVPNSPHTADLGDEALVVRTLEQLVQLQRDKNDQGGS